MEEVDDPVNGVDNVDDPGEVVDDVQKRIFVLDRLDGLIGVEDEEEDEPEKVEEAKDCAPIAPEKKKFKTIWTNLYSFEPAILFQVIHFFPKQSVHLKTTLTFQPKRCQPHL